jgi:uncharacterized protein (DUF2062 family)
MLPFILFLSYITGGLIVGYNKHVVKYSSGMTLTWIKANLLQYLVGSFVFGILAAIVLGTFTWFLLRAFRKPKMVRIEIKDQDQP